MFMPCGIFYYPDGRFRIEWPRSFANEKMFKNTADAWFNSDLIL